MIMLEACVGGHVRVRIITGALYVSWRCVGRLLRVVAGKCVYLDIQSMTRGQGGAPWCALRVQGLHRWGGRVDYHLQHLLFSHLLKADKRMCERLEKECVSG